jgi:hypothetical protein
MQAAVGMGENCQKLADLHGVHGAQEVNRHPQLVQAGVKNQVVVREKFCDSLPLLEIQLTHQSGVFKKETVQIKGEDQLILRSKLGVERITEGCYTLVQLIPTHEHTFNGGHVKSF